MSTCFSIFLFPSSPFSFLLMIHTQVILSCGGQLSKFRKNVVCLESFFFLSCREKKKQIHFSMKDWLMKFKSRFLTRFTDFPLTLDQYPKLETFHTENAIFSQLHVTIKENSYKRTRPILLPNKPHMHILARQGVYLSCGLRGPFFFSRAIRSSILTFSAVVPLLFFVHLKPFEIVTSPGKVTIGTCFKGNPFFLNLSLKSSRLITRIDECVFPG